MVLEGVKLLLQDGEVLLSYGGALFLGLRLMVFFILRVEEVRPTDLLADN